VITYSATLDVPTDTATLLTDLLIAERRRRGTGIDRHRRPGPERGHAAWPARVADLVDVGDRWCAGAAAAAHDEHPLALRRVDHQRAGLATGRRLTQARRAGLLPGLEIDDHCRARVGAHP